MDLRGQEIFSVGSWNNIRFNESDLDSIIHSFAALGLSNRVPLKFGHTDEKDMPEGMPAIGWVSRVWREGQKLMADFSDVPLVVFNAIKSKLYKFVSIEALRDVKAGNRSIPWVLDAVALLGADPPAVGDLKALQTLSMHRSRALHGRERVTFRRDFSIKGNTMSVTKEEMDRALASQREEFARKETESNARFATLEKEKLKDKADSRRTAIKAMFDRKVEDKKLLPRSFERFSALYRLSEDADVVKLVDADIHTFIAEREEVDAPTITANSKGGAKEGKDKDGKDAEVEKGTAEQILMSRKEKRILATNGKLNNANDQEEAIKFVLKSDKKLAQAYFDAPRDDYAPDAEGNK